MYKNKICSTPIYRGSYFVLTKRKEILAIIFQRGLLAPVPMHIGITFLTLRKVKEYSFAVYVSDACPDAYGDYFSGIYPEQCHPEQTSAERSRSIEGLGLRKEQHKNNYQRKIHCLFSFFFLDPAFCGAGIKETKNHGCK